MKHIFIALLSLISLNAFNQIASGTVFNDENKNGLFDPNESGIENILLSNGSDIVKSDAQGNYKINLPVDNCLFVINPSGWNVALNEHKLPQFYYHHKPLGSPKMKYAGISPTGKLPNKINFPLIKTTSENQFEFFVFGDPQPSNKNEIDYFSKSIISELSNDSIRRFGISLGDIVSDNLQDYPLINQSIAKIGIPWYNVIGNHDLNFDFESDLLSDETFKSVFGPTTFAFEYGACNFIILDDVVYGAIDNRKYIGGIREDQFAFIKNYLQHVPKNNLIILCMHIPIFKEVADYYFNKETFRPEDKLRLFELLKDFPHTFSMSAHTHYQMQHFFSAKEGWQGAGEHHHFNVGTTSGDWYKGLYRFDGTPDATMRDGTPQGYAIIKINNNTYDISYKTIGHSLNKNMTLYIQQNENKQTLLFNNFYLGTQYCKSYCMINKDGKWNEMSYTKEKDPRTLEMRERTALAEKEKTGRQISEPQPCYHLWKYDVSSFIKQGINECQVKVVDRNGKIYFETIVFNYLMD